MNKPLLRNGIYIRAERVPDNGRKIKIQGLLKIFVLQRPQVFGLFGKFGRIFGAFKELIFKRLKEPAENAENLSKSSVWESKMKKDPI